MRSFIVVREFTNADRNNCDELVKNYILSFVSDAFFSFLLREITLQLIVLVWAILFIFFGVPLLFCAFCIPFVILFIYLCVYGSHYQKSIELSGGVFTTRASIRTTNNDTNNYQQICWIAEAYEPPYLLNCDRKQMDFDVMTEEQLLLLLSNNSIDHRNKMRKTLVGTIIVRPHNALPMANWIHRMAFDNRYPIDRIAEPLVNAVLKFSYDNHFKIVECTTTEYQYEFREFLLKNGFVMKQVYYKPILMGNSINVMKSQLAINLTDGLQAIKNK